MISPKIIVSHSLVHFKIKVDTMLGIDLLIAVIVRLFGTLLIWAIFYSFPVYIREKVQKFPDERIGILRMLPDLIVWIFHAMRNADDVEDTVSNYVLERLALLMMFTGVIVNLLGDFLFNDEFISALGVEIIGAFIIARILGLFVEFMPSVSLADFQNKTIEEAVTDETPQAVSDDSSLAKE